MRRRPSAKSTSLLVAVRTSTRMVSFSSCSALDDAAPGRNAAAISAPVNAPRRARASSACLRMAFSGSSDARSSGRACTSAWNCSYVTPPASCCAARRSRSESDADKSEGFSASACSFRATIIRAVSGLACFPSRALSTSERHSSPNCSTNDSMKSRRPRSMSAECPFAGSAVIVCPFRPKVRSARRTSPFFGGCASCEMSLCAFERYVWNPTIGGMAHTP